MTQTAPPRSDAATATTRLGVEAKGIEFVTPAERHGNVRHLFNVWWAANVEFATIATGVLATALFGLSFWQAALALVLGNLAGSVLLGLLSTYGPRFGAPQLVQSRSAFGLLGNTVPGALNTISGISWFAVNTVLGVFALDRLLGWSFVTSLVVLTAVQVAIAVYGHRLIVKAESVLMWVLTAIFAVAAVYAFSRGHLTLPFNAKTAGAVGFTGAFIATVSISLSYCLGWVPFASDYSRYLHATTPPRKVLGSVALSMFVSGVWLELLGAALGTLVFVASPTDLMAGVLPHAVAIVTLVGVVVGTITANILNLYSGAMSFKALPLRGLGRVPRWLVTLLAGVLGGIVTYVLGRNGFYVHYETFLFLLGYWIMPWVAILIVDVVSRHASSARMYNAPSWGAGLVCWLLAVAVSVPFMDQYGTSFVHYVGPFAQSHPTLGDLTYYVGFFAALVFYGAATLLRHKRTVRTDGA